MKPISSPSRTEKFPPPLMRFLRSNVGSKSSRGRSRASPMMFLRKKNNATAAAIETQEPSSPKVTCIGQVRVRRSSTRRRRRSDAPTRRPCRWIRDALFCPCFRRKIKPNSSSTFQRWVSFFRAGFLRKPKIRTNSTPPRETPFHGGVEISVPETPVVAAVYGGDEEEEETAKVLISSSSTPPKNALLLTRCRSAPYRSTSLASRFWGSPLKNEQNQEEKEVEEEEQSTNLKNGGKLVEIEKPTSQRASVSDQDPSGGLEFEEEEQFVKNIEDSINEKIIKSADIQREKTGEEEEEGIGSSSRPLILTRCKSEPSRTAEKMNPEVGFWKKRRLGIPESCLPNNL